MQHHRFGSFGQRTGFAAVLVLGLAGSLRAQGGGVPRLWLDRGVGSLAEGWFTTNGGPAANVSRDTAGTTLNAAIAAMGNGDRLYVNAHGAPGWLDLQGGSRAGFAAGTGAQNQNMGIGNPYAIPAQAAATIRLLVCNAGTNPAWAGGSSCAASMLAGLGNGSAATGPARLQSAGIDLQIAGTNARQLQDISNLCHLWCRLDPAINQRNMAAWFENTALANHAANIATLNTVNPAAQPAGGPVDVYNRARGTNFTIGGFSYFFDPAPPAGPGGGLMPQGGLFDPQQLFWDAGSPTAETYTELEPNGTKDEASLPRCILAGDALSGTSLGNSTFPGDGSLYSADVWRLTTRSLDTGIYRHRLTLSGSGHTATLMGLAQTSGTIQQTTDRDVQSSSPTGFLQWYGFGYGEQVYVRVDGNAATAAEYGMTLATAHVVPIDVATPFAAGPLVLSWLGSTNADTDMWVYDAKLQPIPGFGNDDPAGTVASPSRLSRSFNPGTYYVAVSDWRLANDQPQATDEGSPTSDVLDLPEVIAANSAATSVDVSFTISDGTTTVPVSATKQGPFDMVWVRFTVANGLPGAGFCFGDGSGTACPCGNNSATGNGEGCLNSLGAGGKLTASGNPSLSNDTIVLVGSQMPNSTALYFQGTVPQNNGQGSIFGDGLRCAGGLIIRLGTKSNVAGTSRYPSGSDPSVSIKGLDGAGDVRSYQVWYRNAAAFCQPATFNLSNGWQLTWTP